MPLDPSWLPSTAAQSSAALVAIVGGFLINRLVAIDAEQRQSELRLTEADARLREAESEERARWREYVTSRAEAWLTDPDAIDRVLAEGEVPIADLRRLVDGSPEDVPDEDLEVVLREIVGVIAETLPLLDELVPEDADESDLDWRDFRRAQGWRRRRWDDYREEVFKIVVADKGRKLSERQAEARRAAEAKAREKMSPAERLQRDTLSAGAASPKLSRPWAVSMPAISDTKRLARVTRAGFVNTEANRLRDRWDQSRQTRINAEAELRFARRAQVRAVKQPGVTITLIVLSTFAVVGILVPVLALTREHTASAAMKSTVAWCFFGGVVMFLGFMWWYAVRLGQVISLRSARSKAAPPIAAATGERRESSQNTSPDEGNPQVSTPHA